MSEADALRALVLAVSSASIASSLMAALATVRRSGRRAARSEVVERMDADGRLVIMFHRCSGCGGDLPYEVSRGGGYCPRCGARIEGRSSR